MRSGTHDIYYTVGWTQESGCALQKSVHLNWIQTHDAPLWKWICWLLHKLEPVVSLNVWWKCPLSVLLSLTWAVCHCTKYLQNLFQYSQNLCLAYTHTHTHTCTYAHTHVHVHTHTHRHTQCESITENHSHCFFELFTEELNYSHSFQELFENEKVFKWSNEQKYSALTDISNNVWTNVNIGMLTKVQSNEK